MFYILLISEDGISLGTELGTKNLSCHSERKKVKLNKMQFYLKEKIFCSGFNSLLLIYDQEDKSLSSM